MKPAKSIQTSVTKKSKRQTKRADKKKVEVALALGVKENTGGPPFTPTLDEAKATGGVSVYSHDPFHSHEMWGGGDDSPSSFLDPFAL